MGAPDVQFLEVTDEESKQWVPKEWTPVYEQIVLLSCANLSNEMLAEQFQFTKEHISSILTTPQAKIRRGQILTNLREKAASTIDERLGDIAHKTVERLHTLVNDDERFARSPFAVIDRGLKVLSGLGHLAKDKSPDVVNNTMLVTSEGAEILSAALAKSTRARELHGKTEVVIDGTQAGNGRTVDAPSNGGADRGGEVQSKEKGSESGGSTVPSSEEAV